MERVQLLLLLVLSLFNNKCYITGLFAKALTGVNIKDMITNVGSAAAAAPAAAAPAGGAAPADAPAKG